MTVAVKETSASNRPRSTGWTAAWEWLARPNHVRAVRQFREAAESGDIDGLAALLDPEVSVVVDSGDTEHPTIRVVTGALDSATLLVHGMKRRPGLVIAERSVNSQAGLMLTRSGEAVAAMTVDFTGSRVSLVWIRLHPAQLRHWNRV
jgi:hypothetical protein